MVKATPGHTVLVLSEEDHRRVSAAIGEAEQRTSGEIFAVLARSSDSYRYIPLLWAALAALVAGLIAAFCAPLLANGWQGEAWSSQSANILSNTGLDARFLAIAQIIGFSIMAVILHFWPSLRANLVPLGLRHGRASRHAMEQFLAHNLHATSHRTGLLIFVSLAERYAAIIADDGINSQVNQEAWDHLVEQLTLSIADDQLAEGFLKAIHGAGQLLGQHFPPGENDESELPDRLVEF